MCDFFSAIVTRDGSVRFCESDSHEETIRRLGWPDDWPLKTRGWVRVERKWTVGGWLDVRVDEISVPGWYAEDRSWYEGRVCDVADRVQVALAAYQAVTQPALVAYRAIERSTWVAAYETVQQDSLAAYRAVKQEALAAYETVQQDAWAAYEAAISTIEGYVPRKEYI